MDFLIVIISLSLILNAKLEQFNKVCPNNLIPTEPCSSQENCPDGAYCYRDVLKSKSTNTKFKYQCCKSRCSVTGMPHGINYEQDSQTMNGFCSESSVPSDIFYLDKHTDTNKTIDEFYGCCPKPLSDFLYAKESGLLVKNESYSLPAGWIFDETTSEPDGIRPCCTIDDCKKSEYCGRVRNPGNGELVDKTSQNCSRKTKFEKLDGYLRFCYTFPTLNYNGLQISERQKNDNLEDLQLCQTNKDCFNSSHFCDNLIDSDVPNQKIGSCTPIIGTLITSIAARDAFLVHDKGCDRDEQCDELGIKWFSYQCETAQNPIANHSKICVGYEIMCSESALYQRGIHFGCKSDSDCMKKALDDGIHTPQCVQNPFVKNETACCYEMKSCQLDIDLTPYGLPSINRRMCSGDEECQEVANQKMLAQPSSQRNVYWGRCMIELEENWGKCCIADVSTLCSVGKSLLPPRNCSNHSDCGWNQSTEQERNQWCGDEGFCCEDFEEERSWMCPDQKTIRLFQPKCDSSQGRYCNDEAGYCLLNRCCPMVNIDGDFVRVWAETPWYYENLTCSDTFDLPNDMDMIYCDPKRNVVTRMTRGDKWFSSIQASDLYCKSNSDCAAISDSLVCVREMHDLHRCHTYYDRDLKWWLFILPTLLLGFSIFFFFYYWRNDLKRETEKQTESIR